MAISVSNPSSNLPKTILWLSIWLSSMLLLVAVLHAIQTDSLNNSPPRQNELILIEFTLLLIVILIGVGNFFYALFCLCSNQPENLQSLLTSFCVAVSALAIACLIDPNTLFYAPV